MQRKKEDSSLQRRLQRLSMNSVTAK